MSNSQQEYSINFAVRGKRRDEEESGKTYTTPVTVLASEHVSNAAKDSTSKTTLLTGLASTMSPVVVLRRIGFVRRRKKVRDKLPSQLSSYSIAASAAASTTTVTTTATATSEKLAG